MGEATLEHALRDLTGIPIASVPFADIVQRVAGLACDIGLPVAAARLSLVDERGRPLEEAQAGVLPRGLGEGPADRLSAPLEASGVQLGTITLYARHPGAFTEVDATVVPAVAAQAAVVLANARAYWDLHEVASGLQAAMQSRAVIEQAKGKIMAIEGCTPDEAFTLLARASQRDNVKLRELARRIVQDGAELRV